jgi:peptide/nickel transport system substrate-binding protein
MSKRRWFLPALVALSLGVGAVPAVAQAPEALVVDTQFVLKTADPARAYEPTASLFMNAVYETLVTFENGDMTTLMPGIASLPTINADATVFTFTLNPAAKFSDGSPVTVEDAVFSLNRMKNVKGSASFLLRDVKIEAGKNPGEIVLTTPTSDPGFPSKLTYPALSIVNAKVVRANGGTDAEDAAQTDKADVFLATASAGSGPYRLVKFDMVSEIVLERNPNYYGTPAAFSRVIIRNVANNAQRMNVSRNVTHIALDLRPDQIPALGSGVNVISTAGSDMCFVFINANPKVSTVTANRDFVEAVRYGIDYAGLLKIIGEGAGRPGGIVPSILMGTVDGSEAVVRDVARAKAALARSGLSNPTVEMAYASDFVKHGISFGDVGAKLQADLAEIGITLKLVPQPVATNLDAYRAGTLQTSVQWWGPAYPDPSYYLLFNPGKLVGLRAGWPEGSSPVVEAAGAKAASVIDPAQRPAVFKEWQRVLNENGPFIPLFQPAATIVSSKLVEGVKFLPTWTVDLAAVRPAK